MTIHWSRTFNLSLILFIAVAMMAGLSARPSSADQSKVEGIATVVSGSEIEIDGKRIRFHGAAAPELGQQCTTDEGDKWECGQRAADVLVELADNKRVHCNVLDQDREGHAAATCYLGSKNLGAEMIRKCLAWAFLKYSNDYWLVENKIMSTGCGIWSGGNERPWKYRERLWRTAASQLPSGCPIKGVISRAGRIYYVPWSPWYADTDVDESGGGRWFCSETEAVAAGWKPPSWR